MPPFSVIFPEEGRAMKWKALKTTGKGCNFPWKAGWGIPTYCYSPKFLLLGVNSATDFTIPTAGWWCVGEHRRLVETAKLLNTCDGGLSLPPCVWTSEGKGEESLSGAEEGGWIKSCLCHWLIPFLGLFPWGSWVFLLLITNNNFYIAFRILKDPKAHHILHKLINSCEPDSPLGCGPNCWRKNSESH